MELSRSAWRLPPVAASLVAMSLSGVALAQGTRAPAANKPAAGAPVSAAPVSPEAALDAVHTVEGSGCSLEVIQRELDRIAMVQ